MSESEAVLYYWPIKARNYRIMAVAQAGGVKLRLKTDFNLAELKSELPFGQLPYLVDGDIKIAQSNAIFRYISQKGNMQGDTDKDFAFSEMLTEEATDLFNMLATANRSTEKSAAYDAMFAAGSNLHTQLAYLEKLHPGDSPFFNPVKRVAGGIALGSVLDILVGLEPTLLDGYPKMKLFHKSMIESSFFDGIRDLPMFHSRK